MKTSETVRKLGLYASDCCDEELIFAKDDTFWRCPRCAHLCHWELVDTIVPSEELDEWQPQPERMLEAV